MAVAETILEQVESPPESKDQLYHYRFRALQTCLWVTGGLAFLGTIFRLSDYFRDGKLVHVLASLLFFSTGVVLLIAHKKLKQGKYHFASQAFFATPFLLMLFLRGQRFDNFRLDVPVMLFATVCVLSILAAMLLPKKIAWRFCALYGGLYLFVTAIPFMLYPHIQGTKTSKIITAVMPVLFLLLIFWLAQWITTNIIQALENSEAHREKLQESNHELEETNAALAKSNQALTLARTVAQEASKAKSVFLANMSHELRTPLNAIIGYSEIVKEELEDLPEQAFLIQDVDKVLSSAGHLLQLIQDLLDITKIEAGKMELRTEEVDIKIFSKDVVQAVQPLCKRNKNELSFEIDEQLSSIHTDPTKLRQCLLNLLDNATKFTESGKINFSVKYQPNEGNGASVLFIVEDTGIGMSDEQVQRIFDPFWQADLSSRRRFGGTGLGLSLTRELCQRMKGSLHVESKLNEGSMFTIQFPL